MSSLKPSTRMLLCIFIASIQLACAHPRKTDPPDIEALIAQIAKPVSDLCHHDPDICARVCATCPDVAACMKSNGRCAAWEDYYIDVRDAGLSPFVPGCHMKYQDPVCTLNGAFFFADRCAGDRLFEWWNPACHLGMGDMVEIDCRKLCILMRRPGGTCEYIVDVCPGNEKSARCTCDEPQQPPIEP